MAAQQTKTDPPLRADAQRNRLRIIDAAGELFAERGLGVTMDEIAAHAGVGVGTVYRRFPEKELLVHALFEDRIAELIAIAEAALRFEDPWKGLVHFIEGVAAFHARNRAVRELIFSSDPGRAWAAGARARIQPLGAKIVERAQASGDLRDDMSPLDVPLIGLTLAAGMDYISRRQPRHLAPDAGDRARRPARRRDQPTPLSVPALEPDELDRVLAARTANQRP